MEGRLSFGKHFVVKKHSCLWTWGKWTPGDKGTVEHITKDRHLQPVLVVLMEKRDGNFIYGVADNLPLTTAHEVLMLEDEEGYEDFMMLHQI